MKIITIEEHYASKKLIQETEKYANEELTKRKLNTELSQYYYKFSKELTGLYDIEERLKFMEDNKIDMQILSYSNSLNTNIPKDKQVEIYKKANNELYEVTKKYPDKFLAFAILPLSDIDESIKELNRCINDLGFKGVMLDSNFNGMFYDDEYFLPVFKELEKLDVPIYLHPSFVDKRVVDFYYKSNSWDDLTTVLLSSAGFGWHLDIGMQFIRMIVSGLFDKCPILKVIVGHWGEVVIYYIDRMNGLLTPGKVNIKKNIIEYFKENIYVTPSGILSSDMMDFCIKKIGINHIIFSLDYPYVPLKNANEFIEKSSLSKEDKEKIAHINAEKLFKL